MQKLTVAMLTLLAAGAVHADTSALESQLVARGMSEVEPGLYASAEKSSRRFVAVSAAGHQALAQRINTQVTQLRTVLGKNGSTAAEQRFIDGLAKGAEALRAAANKSGYCNSGAQVYATASAYWGTEAMAAAGISLDFGPTTPTSNYAFAGTDQAPGNSSSTVGRDDAVAYVYSGYGCYSAAIATVSCPNGDGPGAAAYQFSEHPGAPYNCHAF